MPYLVFPIVTDNNHQGTLIQLHTVLNKRTNTTIDLLLNHDLQQCKSGNKSDE